MKVPITPVYFRIPLNVTKILNESESTNHSTITNFNYKCNLDLRWKWKYPPLKCHSLSLQM